MLWQGLGNSSGPVDDSIGAEGGVMPNAQQIDKSPWALGKHPFRVRHLKKMQRRAERREAKRDPEDASRRRCFDGYD